MQGRKEAIGRMTNCRTSDQMGTRGREMTEPPQIYTVPAPVGDLQHKRGNKKRKVGGESMGSRSEVKHCGKETLIEGKSKRRRAGDGGAWERSSISWLLFRSTVFSLREELDACIRTSAPRMLECDGWATLFFLSCPFFLLHGGRRGHTAKKPKKTHITLVSGFWDYGNYFWIMVSLGGVLKNLIPTIRFSLHIFHIIFFGSCCWRLHNLAASWKTQIQTLEASFLLELTFTEKYIMLSGAVQGHQLQKRT